VSIQTASGAYVAPTEDSMLAALSTMQPDENGMLQPDPNAGGAVSAQAGAEPYPLTFVEYAMTPKEPLVDTTTCTLRSSSQTLLTNWLTYVLGDGQTHLPAGLVPLPADLQAQGQQSMATIGTAAVTGTCAGRVVTPTGAPVGGAAAAPGPAAGALPSAGGPKAGALANTGLAGGALGTTPLAAAQADKDAKEVLAAVPAFAGHSLPDTTGGVVALLGIVLVTSLAAWLTAGGSFGSGGVAMAGGGTVGTPTRGERPRTGGLVLLWLGVAATGVGLVVYQLGPLLQQRDQHDLIAEYRRDLRQAANSSSGLPGATTVSKAPEVGAPVGVLEIGGLHQQAVVVEGVAPTQTQEGPGHVPGTAGLGQPGNAAVVARRNGYGGSFANLESVQKGERILVTTTQGQSVYRVRAVKHVDVIGEPSTDSASSAYKAPAKHASDDTVTEDQLYGPSNDDRLTLVTSGSRQFWNTSAAVVVTARMVGKPFEPTPQGGRSNEQTGRTGDSGAWSSVILVMLLYAAAIVASVLLYRRMRFRIAYILTVAPLVALTVVAGETLSRLLPAWL
jgi:sortase A